MSFWDRTPGHPWPSGLRLCGWQSGAWLSGLASVARPLAPPAEAAGTGGRRRTRGARAAQGAGAARGRPARRGTVQVRGELAADSDSFPFCSREVASLLLSDCMFVCKTCVCLRREGEGSWRGVRLFFVGGPSSRGGGGGLDGPRSRRAGAEAAAAAAAAAAVRPGRGPGGVAMEGQRWLPLEANPEVSAARTSA
uniref:ubiquitin carboxyl-terminal hydrolase isozyme L3 isoform X2 n=1 Tax=Nyctereutes procyonoides TaxID=34880 RepID=UPI0024440B9F|nr:ubiquitin carboxyl-terminal hydrolase isozyme L3 isoform X2 [Nyctereutes procyonoides]